MLSLLLFFQLCETGIAACSVTTLTGEAERVLAQHGSWQSVLPMEKWLKLSHHLGEYFNYMDVI